jgi:hypothetical protein
MGSNTITPPPVLDCNPSDDERLGLLAHSPRRIRREANNEGCDSSAQDARTRANKSSAMDFGDAEAPGQLRRGSATDTGVAGGNTRQWRSHIQHA